MDKSQKINMTKDIVNMEDGLFSYLSFFVNVRFKC